MNAKDFLILLIAIPPATVLLLLIVDAIRAYWRGGDK